MTCGLLLSSLPFSTIAYQRVCWGGGLNKYQGTAADYLQRPLLRCARFRQRLSASVRVSTGTSRHSVEGCKSLPVKGEPPTLAPRHAWLSVTIGAKRC